MIDITAPQKRRCNVLFCTTPPGQPCDDKKCEHMSDNPDRLYIRVLKLGDKVKYELMHKSLRLEEVSHHDIIEMILQFTSTLRWK